MREKNNIIIREAFRYFRKKKYSDAIAILNQAAAFETQSPYPHFLLCVCCLLSSRLAEAEQAMTKLRRIDPLYPPFVQLEAFLYLKGAPNSRSALVKYIEKLENFPGDKYLRTTLRIMQSTGDFENFQKNARLVDHVEIPKPPPGPLFSPAGRTGPIQPRRENVRSTRRAGTAPVVKIFLIIIIIILLSAGSYVAFRIVERNMSAVNTGPDFESIDLGTLRYDLIDKIKSDKTPFYYFTDSELLKDFEDAKRLIKNGKHNDALIIINKIGNSNANFSVMERADFLRKFILGIPDREYAAITINTVVSRPFLYRGVLVKWNGRIANLKRSGGKMFFNLLVDYKSGDIFAGVIDVYSETDREGFQNGDMIELRATFANTIGADNRLYLVANDLKKI